MSKKKIWIMNHYATNMHFNEGGRHYWFAENLIKQGYEPTIFCANVRHNTNDVIDIKNGKYSADAKNNIPFIFLKTPKYKGNGKSRILNMVSFYMNLFPVTKKYAEEYGKPDVILASSVHPLTLVAGIKIAKKFGVPCICEVRDLWPESIVAYGGLRRFSPLSRVLYRGEKWIYTKADKLIFTMEGGRDYIVDHGWDKASGGPIDLDKVSHINNGIDLEGFNYNKEHFTLEDEDLSNEDTFKVVYAGSIRRVNNVMSIIRTAAEVSKLGYHRVQFLIYGDGDERRDLEHFCANNGVNNVRFKGFINKTYVPYVLSKADLNIFHAQQSNLIRYGASPNKLFEYFASGKPIVSDCEFGFDLVKRYDCGLVLDNASAEEFAKLVIQVYDMSEDRYNELCANALRAAVDYDYGALTDKLIRLF